jgi:hypothetical protein
MNSKQKFFPVNVANSLTCVDDDKVKNDLSCNTFRASTLPFLLLFTNFFNSY